MTGAFTLPRTLPIDAPVEIAITARGARPAVVAQRTLRKPKLCGPGPLTTARYQARSADLKAALSAKALTQDEYGRHGASSPA